MGGPEHPDTLQLAADVVYLESSRLATSTDSTYHSALNRFRRFASRVLHLPMASTLPIYPGEYIPISQVKLFLAEGRHHYSVSSLELTLTAINNFHRSKGMTAVVQTSEVKAIMQAIKREKSDPESRCKPKAGVTAPFLRLIVGWLEGCRAQEDGEVHGFIFLRDEVAFLLGFYGLLRRSEIIALKVEDVQIQRQPNGVQFIEITIRKSKTDQRGQGAMVCIAAVSRHQIPVLTIFKGWISFVTQANPSPTAAFLPAFHLSSNSFGGHLTRGQALATRFQLYIKQLDSSYPSLGFKPQLFAMHSFRRGGTTDAWENGVDKEILKVHGRWRSDAIDKYLQAPIEMRLRVTG